MITAIVLAAGASGRMGRPKMLLPFGKATVLESVLDALESTDIDGIRVVLGFDREAVARAAKRPGVETVMNPAPERGMLTSIQCAIEVGQSATEGYLIVLGDQPHIQPHVVRALIEGLRSNPDAIVVPTFDGKRGHPILVSARFRNEILGLPDTVGLNVLLSQFASEVREIPVKTSGVLQDIDTPADYEKAVSEMELHRPFPDQPQP